MEIHPDNGRVGQVRTKYCPRCNGTRIVHAYSAYNYSQPPGWGHHSVCGTRACPRCGGTGIVICS